MELKITFVPIEQTDEAENHQYHKPDENPAFFLDRKIFIDKQKMVLSKTVWDLSFGLKI